MWRPILPLGLAILGLGINLVVATRMSPTADEAVHVAYGTLILHGHPDRSSGLFDSKMPVSALNALPKNAGDFLQRRGMALDMAKLLQDFHVARYATIAAAFILSLLVFVYARSLYGFAAGLLAQSLFTIDPNIIAHGTLATTDLYVALAAVLFLFFLRRFLLAPTTLNAGLAAITLALAQLTKFTAAYLCVVLILAVVWAVRRIPKRQIIMLLVLGVISYVAAINAGFLFDRSFTPLSGYRFQSPAFRTLQRITGLRAIPIPFPYPYLSGLDWMSHNNATGASFGNIVLLEEVRGSELSRSDGFPSYYTVAYLLKEPIGMQIILLLALVWIFRHRNWTELLAGEGLLLVTATVFWIALSLFSNTQIGIRHILPALPIFAILSGAAIHAFQRSKLLVGGCLLYAVISIASYFPHMIPYFNEIVTDRKMAYKYLADSNLDWGQNTEEVARFLKSNPDVALNPSERNPGRILVNANLLAGVWPKKADYFMRSAGLQPVAHVGYANLLFIVPPKR